MLTLSRQFRPCLILLLLLSVAERGAAVCPENPAATHADEVLRIRECLKHHARSLPSGERFLYTWGDSKKFELMDRWETRFCLIDNSRQRKNEEVKARWLSRTIADYQHPNFAPITRHLHRHLGDLMDVAALSDTGGSTIDGFPKQVVLEAVALGKIYPGFLDNLQRNPVLEYQDLLQRAQRRDLAAPDQLRALGESIGIEQVLDSRRTSVSLGPETRISSSSAGLGVYFATRPIHSIEHFAGGGIACSTHNKRMIDLAGHEQVRCFFHANRDDDTFSTARGCLQKARILIPNPPAQDDPGKHQYVYYNPTGFNQFINPAAFEEASEGYLVRFKTSREYYVSKCAFNYGSCRKITAGTTDLGCGELRQIFARMLAQKKLWDYFTGPPQLARHLFDNWERCARALDPETSSCRLFTDPLRPLGDETSLWDAMRIRPHVKTFLTDEQGEYFWRIHETCFLGRQQERRLQ